MAKVRSQTAAMDTVAGHMTVIWQDFKALETMSQRRLFRPAQFRLAIAGRASSPRRTIMTITLPWDKRRVAAEEKELELIRHFGETSKVLDGPLALPPDSEFKTWLEAQAQKLLLMSEVKKEVLQVWLSDAETRVNALAQGKLSAFSRMQWWEKGNQDFEEARTAMHYVALAQLCAQLKTNKAVFTPHIPSENVKSGVPSLVVSTINAYVEGDARSRLKAFWTLHDERGDGLLHEQAMEDAVYSTVQPVLGAVGQVYPTLPPITKKQRRRFSKYMQYYCRDHDDFPTKLRCLFAWSPKEAEKLTWATFDGFLETQMKEFPEMMHVAANSMALYGRVRSADFAQATDDRDTFRKGIIFLIGIALTDTYVSQM